mgnify:FL=1
MFICYNVENLKDREKTYAMITKIIKFNTTDGIILDGYLNKCQKNTNSILIQIHGMTSNCFKNRDNIISNKVAELNIDTLCFNNRGSEIIKYCQKENGEKILQGTAYEDVEECFYDIVGAIKFVVNLGYQNVYLQGHSLGSTKIVYAYNKMLKENNKYLKYIRAIILLSLVDIPDIINTFTPKKFIELANVKEKENKLDELMPMETSIHPFSVKTFLRYIKYYENINFAQYNNENYNYEELNNINVPLYMRWGTEQELIKQNVNYLVNTLKNKLNNKYFDIGYIDGANHSYYGKEDVLASEICGFLKEIY